MTATHTHGPTYISHVSTRICKYLYHTITFLATEKTERITIRPFTIIKLYCLVIAEEKYEQQLLCSSAIQPGIEHVVRKS